MQRFILGDTDRLMPLRMIAVNAIKAIGADRGIESPTENFYIPSVVVGIA